MNFEGPPSKVSATTLFVPFGGVSRTVVHDVRHVLVEGGSIARVVFTFVVSGMRAGLPRRWPLPSFRSGSQ